MPPSAERFQTDVSGKDRIARYAERYAALNDGTQDFEHVLVHFRHRTVMEVLARCRPRRILEVGCGVELLACAAAAASIDFDAWTIVEASARFADAARRSLRDLRGGQVIEGFFEAPLPAVDALAGQCDIILLAGILHEVPDPAALVRRAMTILAPGGVVHAIVPNANSLHRRLAVSMGLIEHTKIPSERNKELMQFSIFDSAGLSELFVDQGFEIQDSGGTFLKPFTNSQMKSCMEHLPPEVMVGLWRMGHEFPELASEIFIEARKPKMETNKP